MKNLKSILLIATLFLFNAVYAQDYSGDWVGKLSFQDVSLPIVFHIAQTEGNYTASMDSPEQSAFALKAKNVTASAEKILIDLSNIGIQFEGRMEADSILGNFMQGGQVFPLALGRMKEGQYAAPRRPQDPKPKFNYDIEEVTFVNKEANIKLAGTLTLPKGKGPFPAVVLVSGSGPQNRDEELLGHKPFWIIADYLTKNGIAVLRYDDRGTAASEGNFATATTRDFASDAASAIQFLRNQKRINTKKIGIIGHSEGGMVAPLVASADPKVAFIVLLAGPGIPINELMLTQGDQIAASEGAPEAEILKARTMNQKIYNILLTEPNDQKASEQIMESYRTASENDPSLEEGLKAMTNEMISPWFRYFISYNPQAVLEKVSCPVLAINGDKDKQVESKANLEGIKKALEKGGNKKFEIHEMKNMNHLFQTTENGAISEYSTLEETFSPKVLLLMKDWIKTIK